MTTKDEPLTGLELAVAVADKIMGWDTSTFNDKELSIQRPGEHWQLWEPWRDMRAAWEVVEKMQAFKAGQSYEEIVKWKRFHEAMPVHTLYMMTASDAGLAILRAALATVKGEADA